MDRNELRDQLMVPILQWTSLGRQLQALVSGSMEVIWERSHGLLRSLPTLFAGQGTELYLMSSEKVVVPVEALGTTLAALQSQMQQFLSQTAATTSALAGDAMTVGSSVLPAPSTPENQDELGEHLLALLLAWYQLSGRLAFVAEQGLQPLLRQVQDNAARLTKRS